MKVTASGALLILQREPSDPKCSTDSQVLYHLAKALNRLEPKLPKHKQWIKVPMGRDDHLVSEYQHYVVTRDRELAIYQLDYAVRDIFHAFNNGEEVTLGVEGNIDLGKRVKIAP